jgi:hypothetical protein
MAVIVFAAGSFFNFYDYFSMEYENSTKKGMDLFGGIIFGILFIFKMVDLSGSIKKKSETKR